MHRKTKVTEKEKHGARPLLQRGDFVWIGKDKAMIDDACTNIGGTEFKYFEKVIKSDIEGHAWRPEYSVVWVDHAIDRRRHAAWYTLDEFTHYKFGDKHRKLKPWPTVKVEETDSDCADIKD